MIGSFLSGLSGLRANQSMLEVIGNNVANANTIGFKASRVTFSDVLSRTVRGATESTAPVQVGRGAQVSSITTLTRQGALQDSSIASDLAIQGRGFFIVSDGQQEFYTRAGNFSVNDQGELVTPDGFRVQGFNAVNGQIPAAAVQETISFPQEPIAPVATSDIGISGNLDAGSPVLALNAAGNPVLVGGSDGFIGTPIGTVSLTDNGTDVTLTGSNIDFDALQAAGVTTLIVDGRRIENINIDPAAQTITGTRPTLSGTIESSAGSNRVTGTDTQFTTELRVGDTLTIDGQDVTITKVISDTELEVSAPAANDVSPGTTLEFGTTAGLRSSQGVAETLDTPDTSTRLADLPPTNFSIGTQETANILVRNTATGAQSVVSVKGTDTLADLEQAVQRAGFSGYTLNADGFRLSKLDASNGTATSFQAIDSQGKPHTAVFSLFRTDTPNTWVWKITIPDAEALAQDASFVTNSQGTLTFNPDGSLKSFQNVAGAAEFALGFNVAEGTQPVTIDMNLATVSGLTQYNLTSNVGVSRNNGALPGEFEGFSIDANGMITATFSNGKSQLAGQVLLADFNNPEGLSRAGTSLFEATPNSGAAIVATAGQGSLGGIVSGALELSNVDLAEEFTNMILAQRGFQASANVITTTDTIMNDVLGLKRG